MTNDPNGTDRGRGTLRDHVSRNAPPPDVAGRVRATLESRGLVRTGDGGMATRRRSVAWVVRAGLVAAGFLLGLAVRNGSLAPVATPAGQYVLLLYGDPPDDTGAVHVAREREYGRWASSLTGARWVGGHELADVIEDLGPRGAAPVSRERLAGYFVIDAPSRQRAAEIARSCPHLKYGGRVVVMAIAG